MNWNTQHILAVLALLFAIFGGGVGFYPGSPPYAPAGLVGVAVILLAVGALVS